MSKTNGQIAFETLESAIQQSGSGEHPDRPTIKQVEAAYYTLLEWLVRKYLPDIFLSVEKVRWGARNEGCCRGPGEAMAVEQLQRLIEDKS